MSVNVVLAGDMNIASGPIGITAGHYVDADGAGAKELQEYAPVIGCWAAIPAAFVAFIFECGKVDPQDLPREVIAAKPNRITDTIHCGLS